MEAQEYNGWKNYETWNVALWIGNDEGLSTLAKELKRSVNPYKMFVASLREFDDLGNDTIHQIAFETPGNVAWNDSGLDLDALNEMIREI